MQIFTRSEAAKDEGKAALHGLTSEQVRYRFQWASLSFEALPCCGESILDIFKPAKPSSGLNLGLSDRYKQTHHE